MVLAFLILTLCVFSINLALNCLSISLPNENGVNPRNTLIAIFLTLTMITWNIAAIIMYL